ncbi:MAG: hypothetical protein ACK4GK_07250 [Ferrovibrio sp.]
MSLDKLRAKRDEQAQTAERAEIRAKQAKARLDQAENRLNARRRKLHTRQRILAGAAVLEAVRIHGQWEWWSRLIEASTLRDDEKQVLRDMLTQRGVSGATSPANDAGSAPAPTPGPTPPARRTA